MLKFQQKMTSNGWFCKLYNKRDIMRVARSKYLEKKRPQKSYVQLVNVAKALGLRISPHSTYNRLHRRVAMKLSEMYVAR